MNKKECEERDNLIFKYNPHHSEATGRFTSGTHDGGGAGTPGDYLRKPAHTGEVVSTLSAAGLERGRHFDVETSVLSGSTRIRAMSQMPPLGTHDRITTRNERIHANENMIHDALTHAGIKFTHDSQERTFLIPKPSAAAGGPPGRR